MGIIQPGAQPTEPTVLLRPHPFSPRRRVLLVGGIGLVATAATLSAWLLLPRGPARGVALEHLAPVQVAGSLEVDWNRLADGSDGGVPEAIRSETEEATVNLRKLFDSSVAYFEHEMVDNSGRILPKSFPPSTGPTPAGSPCDYPGRRYPENSKLWSDNATWSALMFSVDEPHYYRYTYLSEGSGKTARFTVRAYGDLNCNGVWSTFERLGSVDPQGNVRGPGLTKRLPLE